MQKITFDVKAMMRIAIVAALYVALTYVVYPLSYGNLGIEFRVAEILVLLCFFNSEYIISLSIGCFIANILGPMGIIDAVFGTIATLLSCVCIAKSKNIFISSIYPIVFNAVIIGLELYYFYQIPLVFAMLGVAIGEFVVITLIGCPLFYLLKKRDDFLEIIGTRKK